MSQSIASSVTGKTKVKIVFLGGQAVGKSSIIEKYIHNRFDDTANVPPTHSAHRRHRLPRQKHHSQGQKLQIAALGHSRTVKIQISNPQLPQGCPLRVDNFRCDF